MTKANLTILTNIIGAVESGGQIYGHRRYDAYAKAGANSEKEVTCTLGWAQNYGAEAHKLVQMIFDKDPTAFRNADTANIEAMLKEDWVAKKWNPSSKEKKALIAIILTPEGKQCQDELFHELMTKYIKRAKDYGVTDVGAIMMWCEIQHLGGLAPTERIFKRANKPYTVDTVFASLMLDQKDTSNSNQVGDKKYQSRHECCVKWIKQYVKEEKGEVGMTEQQLRVQVANTINSWIGMDRAKGTHKVIIDTYNTLRPLPRGYKVTMKDKYCAATVTAVAILCGLTDIIPPECGCGQQIALFKELKRWIEDDAYTPKVGDMVYYDWDDSGKGDNTGWPEHVGVVVRVVGKTLTITEGNLGGKVAQRILEVNARYIRGYGVPDYASKAKGLSGSIPTTPKPTAPSPTPTTPTTSDKYTVKKGDSLSAIAKKYKVTVSNLVKWNSIKDKNVIYVGQVLIIKKPSTATSAPSTATSATQGKFNVKVSITDLNIRSGAGTTYKVVKKCPVGVFTIVETKTANGHVWGKLLSGAGWIALEYAKKL